MSDLILAPGQLYDAKEIQSMIDDAIVAEKSNGIAMNDAARQRIRDSITDKDRKQYEQQVKEHNKEVKQAEWDANADKRQANWQKAANIVDGVGDALTGNNLSSGFYAGLNAFVNTLGQDDIHPSSPYLNEQATEHDKQAATFDQQAQQEAGIANRNYKVEADKEAASQAAAKNAQNVQNLSASAGGGAAALNRTVEASDYNTHRQRQDTARKQASEYRKGAANARQTAIGERGAATELNTVQAEKNMKNLAGENLSLDKPSAVDGLAQILPDTIEAIIRATRTDPNNYFMNR